MFISRIEIRNWRNFNQAEADLRRALSAFFAVRASDTNDELDAIDEELARR